MEKTVFRNEAKLKEKIQETLKKIHEITKLELEKSRQEEHENNEVNEEELEETADQTGRKSGTAYSRNSRGKRFLRTQGNTERAHNVKKSGQTNSGRFCSKEQQTEIFGERNSFSKTDPDATFMRIKEDHMKNGHRKPVYFVLHHSSAPGRHTLFYSSSGEIGSQFSAYSQNSDCRCRVWK